MWSLHAPELRGPKSHLPADMASRGGLSEGHPSRSGFGSTLFQAPCLHLPGRTAPMDGIVTTPRAPNPAELSAVGTSVVIFQLPQRQPLLGRCNPPGNINTRFAPDIWSLSQLLRGMQSLSRQVSNKLNLGGSECAQPPNAPNHRFWQAL